MQLETNISGLLEFPILMLELRNPQSGIRAVRERGPYLRSNFLLYELKFDKIKLQKFA